MLDERDDSINDGFFLVIMDGFDPCVPGALALGDVPSSYHNGAGGFNFADGHSEIKRWLDPRTNPPHQTDVHLGGDRANMPQSPDVRWLQEHASSKK